MNNNNSETTDLLNKFLDALTGMIERKLSSDLNKANVEYAFKGIVVEYDSETNTATVDIGSSTTDFIPNHTGETTLTPGDTVKVFSDRRNMMGAYIGVKLTSYISTT